MTHHFLVIPAYAGIYVSQRDSHILGVRCISYIFAPAKSWRMCDKLSINISY